MSLNKFKGLKRNAVCRRREIDLWGRLRYTRNKNSRLFRKFYKKFQRKFRLNVFTFRMDNNKPPKPKRHYSLYGLGMLTKQNVKYFFGNIPERRFRRFFAEIRRFRGDRYRSFIRNLESRLLMIVMRSNLFATPYQIKQLILHGHVYVNSKVQKDYYFRLNVGDYIHFSSQALKLIKTRLERNKKTQVRAIFPPVGYLLVSYNIFRIVLIRSPNPNVDKLYPFNLDPLKLLSFYNV